MGLFSCGFGLMVGTAFGVYVAQNYNIPNLKTLANTGLVMAEHIEKTYRRPKESGADDKSADGN